MTRSDMPTPPDQGVLGKSERDRRVASILAELRDGKIVEAAAGIAPLLADLPDDPAVHQVAAVIALGRSDPVAAGVHAAQSLRHRPQHVPTLLIAGRAARLQGELDTADRAFSEALQLEPRRAEAVFLACVTRLERGDPGARTLLDRLVADFPEDDGWLEIGLSLQRAGKTDAAFAAFARAHRRPDSHLRRGVILQQRRETASAVAAFETAVAMDGRLAEAWFRLGVLYQDQHRRKDAVAAYQKALAQRPDLAEAEVNLGLLLQEAGERDAAYACYRRALALRPESFGRIAQGISAGPHGQMWLDLGRLRQLLQA